MGWYGVRHVVKWGGIHENGSAYEELVTIWNANSFDEAVSHAAREAGRYASEALEDGVVLDLWQGFMIADPDVQGADDDEVAPFQGSGTKVFSLISESDLPEKEYLDRFFDTGTEHNSDSP
jgi:hypothetical protein